jgi:excisionase family DNA binding protein
MPQKPNAQTVGYWTVAQVAEKLSVSKELIRRQIRKGTLHAVNYGGGYVIKGTDLDRWLWL